MFDAVTAMAPHVRAGKVKALATSGRTRSQIMPEVPTLAEAGLPGYEAVIWLGLMAPAKTPPAVLRKLNAEVARIVARPDVQAKIATLSVEPAYADEAAFGAALVAESAKIKEIIKTLQPSQ
jgi:tripartite-type tricarboxylate transporter receptor subunit TctC